ncbi:hypothetical protein PG990_008657 [Apiospora arundinis]
MTDQQEKKAPRGLIGAILANKKKRSAENDGAETEKEATLARPAVQVAEAPVNFNDADVWAGYAQNLVNKLDPTSRNFFAGNAGTIIDRISEPEAGTDLMYQYKDLQPDGQFPDSTAIIRQNNAHAEITSSRWATKQRKPLPAPPAKGSSAAAPAATAAAPGDKGPVPGPQTEDAEPEKKKRKGNPGEKEYEAPKVPIDQQTCGWCDKPGHKVLDCAGPPKEDGFIHACPLHNVRSHTLRECRLAKNWDLGEKWYYLVSRRHKLPPLAANDDWETVAQDHARQTGPVRQV